MKKFIKKIWSRGDRVEAGDINRWEDGIADAHAGLDSLANNTVTHEQARATLDEYDRKLFESASLLHQIDRDTTIENTREGKLTSRSLTGRTLVNLWSDNREDFTTISSVITVKDSTATLATLETSTTVDFTFFQPAARLKPNTRYTIVVDTTLSPNVSLILSSGASQANCAFTTANDIRLSGRSEVVLTTKPTLAETMRIRFFYRRLGEGAINASAKISIYEGDLTKLALNHTQPLTLASVGGGVDKMQVKTAGVNLFGGEASMRIVRNTNITIEPLGGWQVGVQYYVRITGSNATTTVTNGVIIVTDWSDGSPTTFRAFRGAMGHNGDSFIYFTLPRESKRTYLSIHTSNAAGTFVDVSNIQISQVPVADDLLPFTPHQSTTSTYEYQNDDGRWLPVPNLKGIMSGGDLLIGDEITDNEYIQRVVEVDLSNADSRGQNALPDTLGNFSEHWFRLRTQRVEGLTTMHITSNKLKTGFRSQGAHVRFNSTGSADVVIMLPSSTPNSMTTSQALQYLIDNDYQFIAPLATPKHYPIRTQSLSSFNPTTNVVMQTGAVQPRFNFKIVQSLSERMTVAEGSIRKQGDKISDVNADLDNLVNKIDALKPTTAPLPLATTPQIGTSGRYADANHVHQMPTASQIGALPLSGGTVTGALNVAGNVRADGRQGIFARNPDQLEGSIQLNFLNNIPRIRLATISSSVPFRIEGQGDFVRFSATNTHAEVPGTFTAGGNVTAPRLIGNADTASKLQTSRPFAVTGAVEGTVTSDLANGVTINTQNRLVSVSDWDNIDPTTLGLRNGDMVNIVGASTSLNQPQGTTSSTWGGILRRIHSTRFQLTVEHNVDRRVIRMWNNGAWGGWQDVNETALRLRTPRQINGTNFDGSANITTTRWGTARNIKIGDTTRSVDGSGNVTWSLADIGAAPAVTDTGWIDLVRLNGTQAHPDSGVPQYRRIGNVLYLRGAFTNILQEKTIVARLPVGCRPPVDHSFAQNTSMQAGNAWFARWEIDTNGDIWMTRINNPNGYTSIAWFPIDTSFLID